MSVINDQILCSKRPLLADTQANLQMSFTPLASQGIWYPLQCILQLGNCFGFWLQLMVSFQHCPKH